MSNGSSRGFAKRWLRRCAGRLDLRPRALAVVVGCPRSGTTAVLRWLDRQPGVAALNESRILVAAHGFLREVERFASLQDDRDRLLESARTLVLRHYSRKRFVWRRVVVDKEPLERVAFPGGDYEAFLGSVRSLFPAARLLFMVREPVPTIWSMRQKAWGDSLAAATSARMSLEACIETWRTNAHLIERHADDRGALRCRFEDLVGRPESESQRIADFLGLRGGTPFLPAPTQTVDFKDSERARILEETIDERTALGY